MSSADSPLQSTEQEQSGVSLWEFMYVGYSLHCLTLVSEGRRIQSERSTQDGVLYHCRVLKEAIEKFRLYECYTRCGTDLDGIFDDLTRALGQDGNAKVDAVMFRRLRQLAPALQEAFSDEARRRITYPVLPAHRMKVERMLSNPSEWFGFRVADLPFKADAYLDDFQEAARCFAVGFYPAAIVFALRGTEGIFREYYQIVTGKPSWKINKWGKIEQIRWYLLEEELKDPQWKCPEPLLTLLPKLRDSRNEAMHSGRRDAELWGTRGAMTTLDDCQSALLEMTIHLERLQAMGFPLHAAP